MGTKVIRYKYDHLEEIIFGSRYSRKAPCWRWLTELTKPECSCSIHSNLWEHSTPLSASLWLTFLFLFFPPVLLRIKHRPCWVSTLPLRYIPASPFGLRESHVVQAGPKLSLEQRFTASTYQILELQAYATMPGRNFFFLNMYEYFACTYEFAHV